MKTAQKDSKKQNSHNNGKLNKLKSLGGEDGIGKFYKELTAFFQKQQIRYTLIIGNFNIKIGETERNQKMALNAMEQNKEMKEETHEFH